MPSGGNDRRGMVKRSYEERDNQLLVSWFTPDRFKSEVGARAVSSGFINGMDVQDATPGTGVRSLGVGRIMQQRVPLRVPSKCWLIFQKVAIGVGCPTSTCAK